ncbi:MAG: NosD domain-containing protein, partial [Actinomycetota bacterium]
ENTIEHNNAFCRGGGGEPSTGGSGIVILGGRGNTIQGNVIVRNRTSRNIPFHGGVVLVEHASNNTVTGNTLLRNRPNTCTPGC